MPTGCYTETRPELRSGGRASPLRGRSGRSGTDKLAGAARPDGRSDDSGRGSIRRTRSLVAGLCCLLFLEARAEEFPGFAIEPPERDEWHQVARNANSLVWMRRVPGAASTFGVAVLTQTLAIVFEDPDAFLGWVRDTKTTNPDPHRFRIGHSRLTLAPEIATFCVRYATVIEDRAGGPSGRDTLELRVAGLACLHPVAPNRFYDIQYSSRGAAGQPMSEEILDEGRRFVDSLRFTQQPADGRWTLGEHAPTRLDDDAA